MLVKALDGKKEYVFTCSAHNFDGTIVDFNNADEWEKIKSRTIKKLEAIGYKYEELDETDKMKSVQYVRNFKQK